MDGDEAAARIVRRGDVHLLDLSTVGGRLAEARPVLVVQNDVGNARSAETTVIAIRDLHRGRMLPIFVPLSRGTGGLTKDSVADAGHIVTVAKERLRRRLGALPPAVMCAVDEAIRISLDLI